MISENPWWSGRAGEIVGQEAHQLIYWYYGVTQIVQFQELHIGIFCILIFPLCLQLNR